MAKDRPPLSAWCAVAEQPGYENLHADCRQTRDVPLPHYPSILLQRRCGCACHGQAVSAS
ncbi:hypothetical protein [Streptomyces sp. NPDC002845]